MISRNFLASVCSSLLSLCHRLGDSGSRTSAPHLGMVGEWRTLLSQSSGGKLADAIRVCGDVKSKREVDGHGHIEAGEL